jgi:hypothetical protein
MIVRLMPEVHSTAALCGMRRVQPALWTRKPTTPSVDKPRVNTSRHSYITQVLNASGWRHACYAHDAALRRAKAVHAAYFHGPTRCILQYSCPLLPLACPRPLSGQECALQAPLMQMGQGERRRRAA